MGRMPYHVHVVPYRKREDGEYLFAIFERADYVGIWQGICGGGEAGETIVESALRESLEEGGITRPGPLYPLDYIECAPSTIYKDWSEIWGKNVLMIPMYFFGMPYDGTITISDEHREFRWCTFDEANALIKWPSQRTSLWELRERLSRGNIEREIPAYMHEVQTY